MIKVQIYGYCPFDVESIYREHGLHTNKFIRGDYTIKIIDDDKTIYITDFIGSQSFKWLPRNSTIVVKDNDIIYSKDNTVISPLIYDPPAGVKKKDSFEDLFEAIDESVKFRYEDNCFITMSSGHDSGTIVASAKHQDLNFTTLTVSGIEYKDVIDRRLAAVKNSILVDKWNEKRRAHEVAARRLAQNGCKTLLSGLCADELLDTNDFQLATQFCYESQLYYDKYKINVRYPLADPKVFWEWYSLDPRMRIKKRPLMRYMDHRNFPFADKKKKPFTLKDE